ncbi:MAG: RNA 2',3'-cyclic phosphodiesterase [bacterium]
MRVFIAVELAESIRTRIVQIQSKLRGTEDKIKWVDPSLIHLTLKFLGEIKKEKLGAVIKVTQKIAQKFSPFSMGAKGVGAFPSFSSPRVIWLGVGSGSTTLQKLAGELENHLAKNGFSEEKKKWTPHLTLGRVKSLIEQRKLSGLILREKEVVAGKMEVKEISVIESRLTPSGPIYTVLERITLKGNSGATRLHEIAFNSQCTQEYED